MFVIKAARTRSACTQTTAAIEIELSPVLDTNLCLQTNFHYGVDHTSTGATNNNHDNSVEQNNLSTSAQNEMISLLGDSNQQNTLFIPPPTYCEALDIINISKSVV